MSGKNKLRKFSELLEMTNVYENFDFHKPELVHTPGNIVEPKGNWKQEVFQNENPLVLELACGRGEYALGLSRLYPEKNFIGIDIKGARIWKGASIAKEEALENVRFIRTKIELITHFFAKDEIDEIWITFPDPFLKDRKENRRLTSPIFLNLYQQILKPNGVVRLKTDNPKLYQYSLDTFSDDPHGRIIFHHHSIYEMGYLPEELQLKTYYEAKHLEDKCTIKYIEYMLN